MSYKPKLVTIQYNQPITTFETISLSSCEDLQFNGTPVEPAFDFNNNKETTSGQLNRLELILWKIFFVLTMMFLIYIFLIIMYGVEI